MPRATGDQVNSILGQTFEILRLTRNGTRAIEDVKRGLQQIIQGEQLATPVNGLIHGRFTPAETQVAWVKHWNVAYDWGFTDSDFKALGEPPLWLADNPLAAVVLTPYLDTPEQTYQQLVKAAVSRQPDSYVQTLSSFLQFAEWAQMELAPGLSHQPGLKWELVDLGYGVGRDVSVREYERPPNAAHAAVLAAAALHPEWVRQMRERKSDGDVPCVAVVGYRIDSGKYYQPTWEMVPEIGWGAKSQHMTIGYIWRVFENYAQPIHLPVDR